MRCYLGLAATHDIAGVVKRLKGCLMLLYVVTITELLWSTKVWLQMITLHICGLNEVQFRAGTFTPARVMRRAQMDSPLLYKKNSDGPAMRPAPTALPLKSRATTALQEAASRGQTG